MIIPDITAIVWERRSMGGIHDAYAQYRNAMEVLLAVDSKWKQNQVRRDLAELRDRYLTALKAVTFDDERGTPHGAYQRYLLHIKKTIAGLVQLILQHAVRKLRPSQPPFSLLYRVRQITVTHPAIAPPQFA